MRHRWRERAGVAVTLSCAMLTLAFGGCGVGTYRAARVTGALEMRLVAADGRPGVDVARWFSDERLSLEEEAFIESSHVREVHLERRPDETQHIVVYLDTVGTARLAEVTAAHGGRRLAIVVDGRVVVAPTIRTAIDGGEAHITVGPEGDIEQVFDALTRERRAP